MKRFWYENNPALYEQMKTEVSAKYQTLHFEMQNQNVCLNGTFPIADAKGILDYFRVEITLPHNFPEDLPIVREVGGRIPQIPDRHMFNDGTACLYVAEDWYFSHPKGYSLLEFLDGAVRAFFAGQICIELGKPWPYGERSHGSAGILECYMDLTEAPNFTVTTRFIQALAQQEIKGHYLCPCGSGEKIRRCHKKLLEVRERVPLDVLRFRWNLLAKVWQRVLKG